MKPNIPVRFSYLIILATISFIVTAVFLNLPIYYGLFSSVFFSIIVLRKKGFSTNKLLGFIINGVKECTPIYILLLIIGGIISIWIASGTVPTMIYYGLDYLNGGSFIVACFLISLIVSMVMGTAVGTISTIGIALIAIGEGLFIPTPILVAAIVSGAFMSDKASPIASMVNLVLKTMDLRYKEYLKYLSVTQVPIILLGVIFYYLVGKSYTSNIDPSNIAMYQNSLLDNFTISPYLLLLPITILALAIIGIKIIPIMVIGLIGGSFVSFFIQEISFIKIIETILFGYRSTTGAAELDNILKGGGLIPMFEVILVIIGAVSLSSIFEGTNLITPLINKFINKVKGQGELVLKTSILSNLITIITCDQTVGILLLGKMLKGKFNELNLDNYSLARTITDSGTIIAPLLPWGTNSIIIVAITGVSVMDYGLYALPCYIAPIITILAGFMRNMKTNRNTPYGHYQSI